MKGLTWLGRTWHGHRPLADGLAIGAVSLLSAHAWLNNSIPAGDFAGFYVWSWYLKESLLQTQVMPSWSPLWLAGATFYELFPFLGLWVILPAVALGSILGTKLIVVGLIALSGFSIYWLARHLCGNRNGALLASISYVLFPYHVLVTAVYFHLDQVLAFAWVPLVLLLLLKAVEGGRRHHIVLAGIALGLLPLMNLEYVVTLFPLALLLGAFLLLSPWLERRVARQRGLFQWPRGLGKRAKLLALIGGIAAAAGAWWSLPSLASFRAHFLLPPEYTQPFILTRFSMLLDRAGRLWGQLMPNWAVDLDSGGVHPVVAMYNGAFYLGLALLGLWVIGSINLLSDRETPRRAKHFFVLFSLVFLLGTYLALGTNYRFLANVFPLASHIRSPFRFLFLSSLALPLLAALSYTWLESKLASRRPLMPWAPHALGAIMLLAVLVDFYPYHTMYRYHYREDFIANLKGAYAFAGQDQDYFRIANPKDYDPVYNLGIIYSGKPILGAWVWWTATVPFGDFYIRHLLPHMASPASLQETATYLGQASVKYLITDSPPGTALEGVFTQVSSSGPFTVWENSQWRPFVEAGLSSSLSWSRPAPGEIVVFVEAPDDTLLTVRESHSPNWRAYVDGQSVAPVITENAFLGVPLERGTHRVVLRYQQPAAFLIGGSITGLLGMGLAWGLVSSRAKRRSVASPAPADTVGQLS